MRVETKEIRKVVARLDAIVKDYKEENPPKDRDWQTYELRLAERLRKAFRELRPLVREAVSTLQIVKGETRGRNHVLTLEQRVLVLLLKRIVDKSNRTMSFMMVIFSWLTGVSVSYKTVERLYSDHEVRLALHNLHLLILKKRGITVADCTGDGTGYALVVKVHYATEAQKLKDKIKENQGGKRKGKKRKKRLFIYSFALMDLDTRMYIGYGWSFKSEKEAFLEALDMTQETGIEIRSLRLDKYFSTSSYVELCQEHLGKVQMYLLPKSNATVKGSWEWKRMLERFVNETEEYLKEYFQRNQSESGISEDKKRTGWKLGQKRPDRIATAIMLTGLWHNLCWLT